MRNRHHRRRQNHLGAILGGLLALITTLGALAAVFKEDVIAYIPALVDLQNRLELAGENQSLKLQGRMLAQALAREKRENERLRAREAATSKKIQQIDRVLKSVEHWYQPAVPEGEDRGGIGGLEVDPKQIVAEKTAREIVHSSKGKTLQRFSLDQILSILPRIPLATPGTYTINSPYGWRRSPFSRRWRIHKGIDFSMPYGSKVYATADGIITDVRRTGTYGLLIDIAHSEHVYTRYAHLRRAEVKPGDAVKRGMVLGYVGKSGNTTGAHLHYEVRVDDEAINPEEVMALSGELQKVVGAS